MKRALRNKFYATAIGSVPHINAKKICKRIIGTYSDIPFWPQMPKRSFLENMYAQYLEGFPCAVIDEGARKLWIDTSKDLMGEIEKAYARILDNDEEYFAVTKRSAAGLHEFIAQAGPSGLGGASFVKGHITGPISFGLSVTDENKQSILYHPELSEAMVKILAIKAGYQIRLLQEVTDRIIIFIDEPYLVSIGSSVVNINKDDAIAKISEIVDAIHARGALAGIHCCGNTDWPILLGTDIDILNFDAYGFLRSLSLYPEPLKGFLDKGNILAWGIAPTSDDLKKESVDTLYARIEKGARLFNDKGLDVPLIMSSLMVTPSCGCGTLDESDAEHILDMNVKLSAKLRGGYGE